MLKALRNINKYCNFTQLNAHLMFIVFIFYSLWDWPNGSLMTLSFIHYIIAVLGYDIYPENKKHLVE